jgi:hypothetical protein
MNFSKISLAAALVAASLAVACGGSDSGKTPDPSGTGGTGGNTGGGKGGNTSSPSGGATQETSHTETCQGSSLCINGSCKCTEGPQKGSSCCEAPESDEDPPCAKADQCDNFCNSCK